jgi:hypothetical protein
MRHALVKDNEIHSWILWDGVTSYQAPQGYTLVSEANASHLPIAQKQLDRETLVFPFNFIDRFTLQELSDIQRSVDPLVIKFRTKIQTMVQPVDLDNDDTIAGLGYLEMIGLLAAGRANELRGI